MDKQEAIKIVATLVQKGILLRDLETKTFKFNPKWKEWKVTKRSGKERRVELVEFNLEESLKKMESKENSHLDIIATFIREKPVQVENSKQLSGIITRYARVAQQLSGAYTNKQIFTATASIQEENKKRERRGEEVVDYTLETVYKKLTK